MQAHAHSCNGSFLIELEGFPDDNPQVNDLSHIARKPATGFPTRSDSNRAVQPPKMARCMKFRI